MCLIIDSCVAHRAVNMADPDFAPVRDSLSAGEQVLVIGGQLLREYKKYREIVRFVVELDRRGRARIVRDERVDAETQRITDSGLCGSNDQHLVALARVTGARLLCTSDGAAAHDFTRKELLDHPRGKVYQKSAHRHLLRGGCFGCL